MSKKSSAKPPSPQMGDRLHSTEPATWRAQPEEEGRTDQEESMANAVEPTAAGQMVQEMERREGARWQVCVSTHLKGGVEEDGSLSA